MNINAPRVAFPIYYAGTPYLQGRVKHDTRLVITAAGQVQSDTRFVITAAGQIQSDISLYIREGEQITN